VVIVICTAVYLPLKHHTQLLISGVNPVPFLALFITRNGNTAAQAGLAVAAYSLGGFGAAWIASLAPEEHVRALLRFSQLCLVCGE
jgi:hypothetical protein